jgi:curved DNA-binding protein CbpA
MPQLPDHYRTLQVHPEADLEVIQVAYRRLARRHHPDAGAGTDEGMAQLNAAYAVLRDPIQRAAYDAALRRASPPAAGARPAGAPGAAPPSAMAAPGPSVTETSPRWTSGRSTTGGGYDPASMRSAEGLGAAGPPPGRPSGSVLNFGRYAGWSLGEIVRHDPGFLEWLDRTPIGRPYQQEIDQLLRSAGRRRPAPSEPDRPGLFRRR